MATISSVAAAQVDISCSMIGEDSGSTSYEEYGISGGIRAYAVATTACNVGSVIASWDNSNDRAPIIGTNMFRLKSDGGFEQLGYSYVKYSFCALDEGGDGCPNACQPMNCDWLGLGCADTYWASLNDGRNGGAKYNINPTTAVWPNNQGGATQGNNTIRGRLQVQDSELQDSGALYFSEGQYLHQDDHADGNARDNYCWRRISFANPNNITNMATSVMGDPALYAWQAHSTGVLIDDLTVNNEGGNGNHGHVFIGSKAVDLGGGQYRYFYSVQNGNSGRAISGLHIPHGGGTVSNVYYHDVNYHSGSPYSNTPWSNNVGGSNVSWESTQTHAQNSNANVIRWGTMFSFAFTCNAAPVNGVATLDIFAPGTGGDTLSANVISPGQGCGGGFSDYCTANSNSSGFPALITAGGSPSVAANDLSMAVTLLPQNQFGYFLMSENQTFIPNFAGSNGNLCVGSPQKRFSQNVLHSGATGSVSMPIDNQNLPQNSTFNPGDTWNFQYWYRDIGSTSNTSAGVQVDFCN